MAALRPLTLIATLAFTVAAQGATHELKTTYRSKDLRAVEVENLAGAFKLLPAAGDELVIEYTVVAGGDDDAEARALAETIKFKTEERDGRLIVLIEYPVDAYRGFVYRGDGYGHQTNTEYQGRRVQVSSRDRGGADLHVDVVARLPRGFQARFENHVGEIVASGVAADLELDTGSGLIEVSAGRGVLRGDTGSGAITVRDHAGEVEADTGSGHIEIEGLVGDVKADTGSGGITLRGVKAKRIAADTGSGRIEIEDSSGALDADTGSGGVHTRGFTAGERVRVDTGSGGVSLEGDLSAVRDLVIDTGSGGATLRSSKPFDLRLEVETGSGGIRVDVPGMTDVRQDDGEFSATLGRGTGRAVISTGSGGARIEQTR